VWISETPWPAIVACVLAAAVLFTVWYARAQIGFLLGSVACLALAGAAYVVEGQLVTESERLEIAIEETVLSVKAGDKAAVLDRISVKAPDVRGWFAAAMDRFEVLDEVRVKQVSVELKVQNSRAVTSFRANGPIRDKHSGAVGRGATRWEFTWQREADDWRIIRVTRLDPFTGEEIDRFAPQ